MNNKLYAGDDVVKAIKLAHAADIPVMLEGRHGIGKSQLIEQAAREMKVDFIVRDLSLMEPPDLVGLPVQKNGRTQYSPPSFLPASGRGILCFEEINRSEKYMLAPCLELLTRRVIGDYHLPEGWLPVAAINPQEEGYDTTELDPALLSRFIRLRVHPHSGKWLAYAKLKGVHPAVIRYVTNSGAQIFDQAESNPRAWCWVSDVIKVWEASGNTGDNLLLASVAGLVGDIHGAAFMKAYRKTEAPFEADVILQRYNDVQAKVRAWRKEARTDLLGGTAHNVQCALQNSQTCQEIARSRKQLQSLQQFIKDLPADLANKVHAIAHRNGALKQ